jgi:hypothetical protein
MGDLSANPENDLRVLVVAPIGRDGLLIMQSSFQQWHTVRRFSNHGNGANRHGSGSWRRRIDR